MCTNSTRCTVIYRKSLDFSVCAVLDLRGLVPPALHSNGCRCTRVSGNALSLLLDRSDVWKNFSPPTPNARHHRERDLSHRACARPPPPERPAGAHRCVESTPLRPSPLASCKHAHTGGRCVSRASAVPALEKTFSPPRPTGFAVDGPAAPGWEAAYLIPLSPASVNPQVSSYLQKTNTASTILDVTWVWSPRAHSAWGGGGHYRHATF